MTASARGARRPWVRWLLATAAVAVLFGVMQVLPLGGGVDWLGARVEGLGPWGAVLFGAVYVLAGLLLVPGSLLTLAAGALFGLLWGTVVVSVSATAVTALAFLIARYMARDKVRSWASQNPKFAAIDAAIREGGWRIVALLRLSPVVPFNLQNYLYGLTPIGFWPQVVTSWLAMLPGTFMYVYLGYLGREGAEDAADQGSTPAGVWALRIVGLAATVAVTVYLTRLARRKLREQTAIEKK